jgi:hypothetical protein
VGERRRLCCLSRAIWVRLFQRSLNLLFLWLAQHLAANLLRGRSAVAVAAAAQKAVGDDSASRRAHAAAHPHVRNRYASTSNKGPRREPFERLRWRVRNMVEITPQYPRSQRKFADWANGCGRYVVARATDYSRSASSPSNHDARRWLRALGFNQFFPEKWSAPVVRARYPELSTHTRSSADFITIPCARDCKAGPQPTAQ